MRRRKSDYERDLGLRLLKLLLLRLYSMMSTNPLKWWEALIAVVMGALFGVGLSVIFSSYLKSYVVFGFR